MKTAEKEKAPRRSSEDTRAHVLRVAHELFYWQGIRAIGVDRVAAEAGIAPPTLYRLFSSKDELIVAYVERADREYREWVREVSKADGRSARQRILALFDALTEPVQPEKCRGCPFLMVLTEFPDSELECHRLAIGTKKWVRSRIGAMTAELGKNVDAGALADQLTLIMEGVYASVQALGVSGPAKRARAFAESLLPKE